MKRASLTVTVLAALAGAIALISCARTEHGSGMGTGTMQSAKYYGEINSYPATGVVESVASDWTHVTIRHQAIPGLMEPMTMDLAVKNTNELNGLSPGDKITFQLLQANDKEWIQDINRTGQ